MLLSRVLLYLLIKVKFSIISSNNNICAFYFHFLTNLKTLLEFLPISLSFLTAFSFIALATAFLAAFFNLLSSILVSSVGFYVISLYASFFFCISSFAPLLHYIYITLHFLFFLYPHTSSHAFSTLSLRDPIKHYGCQT